MRLKEKFRQLRVENRKAFIAYVPFGFPDIKSTKDICLALQESGADAIELGIPFSDPLADGPIIQKATSLAIEKGANIDNFFDTLGRLKDSLRIPIVVMSYYNPIFNFGSAKFLKKVSQVGVTAAIIVDLPLEESADYLRDARKYNLDTIFFVTPVTSFERIKKIVKVSSGFIYYVSVTGITGPKDFNYISLAKHVRGVKSITDLPVCIGFGIHSREQVTKINKFSDGVIVGSEIVRFIEKHHRDRDFLDRLKLHIKSLKSNRQ